MPLQTKVASYAVDLGDSGAQVLRSVRRRFPRLMIQLVSLRNVNARVIEAIARQTEMAKKNGTLLTEREELDLLLRLAGTRQIAEALALAGYDAKGTKVLVAIGTKRDQESLRKHLGLYLSLRILSGGEFLEDDRKIIERAALLSAT